MFFTFFLVNYQRFLVKNFVFLHFFCFLNVIVTFMLNFTMHFRYYMYTMFPLHCLGFIWLNVFHSVLMKIFIISIRAALWKEKWQIMRKYDCSFNKNFPNSIIFVAHSFPTVYTSVLLLAFLLNTCPEQNFFGGIYLDSLQHVCSSLLRSILHEVRFSFTECLQNIL